MIQAVLDVSEFSVKFDVVRFIRIFIYHILFFYVGPFILPLVSLFDSNGLVRNMGFWLSKSVTFSFFLQYTQWIFVVFMYIMWTLHFLHEADHDA